MNNIDTGGPAFPGEHPTGQVEYIEGVGSRYVFEKHEGMTLRQYAAIHLKVPNSGTEWLDDMIRESVRDDMAAKAMQGLAASPNATQGWMNEHLATSAWLVADVMLKARAA